MKNQKVLWITQTAMVIALLIVLQAATAPLGNTMITGSLVNLMLVIGVMVGGLTSGLTVAVLSPVFAKIFGIGPLWSLIPFIALGNVVLVLCWYFIGTQQFAAHVIVRGMAAVTAAVAKFIVLFVGIVQIAVPVLLQLPEKQAAMISATFSFPQLITALIGGGLAIIVLPLLGKALKKEV